MRRGSFSLNQPFINREFSGQRDCIPASPTEQIISLLMFVASRLRDWWCMAVPSNTSHATTYVPAVFCTHTLTISTPNFLCNVRESCEMLNREIIVFTMITEPSNYSSYNASHARTRRTKPSLLRARVHSLGASHQTMRDPTDETYRRWKAGCVQLSSSYLGLMIMTNTI